jgi:hypothetical protein
MKLLYLIACFLLLAAIAADFCGKSYYSDAAGTANTDHERSITALRVGHACTVAGSILAMLGVVFWAVSMVKGKRLTPIPLVLLIAYIMLSVLLMV